MDSRDWAAFDVDEVDGERADAGGPWREFLRVPTLRTGLYALPAGGEDRQRPHADDEVYYVIEGRAVLRVGDDEVPVKPGSVVYVKAGVDHRFHDIEDDLKVLVFFSTDSRTTAGDPP